MEKTLIENQLVEKSRNGDTQAFAQLIKLYRKQLVTYLWKLGGSMPEAEDLFQETLIKVWEGLPGYRHQNKFSSWLFSIAHNVAMDALRKNKTRSSLFSRDDVQPMELNTPHTDYEARELQGILNDALESLNEKQKRVFLLREHGDMTFKEISELTKEPLNTVLGHMHYAVEKLRKKLRVKNVI